MTPELKAAAERVRRVAAVGQHSADMRIHLADLYALATAYLAEHPADDDEPVTLEWIKSKLPWVGRISAKTCGGVPYVFIGDDIEIKTRGQLRALLKGLGR